MSTTNTPSIRNSNNRPRLLVVTELFPNPDIIYSGSFVVAQLIKLSNKFSIEVIVPYYIPITKLFSSRKKQPSDVFKVHYIPLFAYDLYALYFFKFINYSKMKLWLKNRSARALLRVAKIRHRKNPFALIHGHEVYVGDEAGPIGHALGIPSVVTIHSLFPFHQQIFGRASMLLSLQNLNQVDRIVAVSKIVAKSYRDQGIADDKVTVIPNGVAEPQPGPNLRYQLNIPSSSVVLLSVGTFSPSKKFTVSLQALKKLHGQGLTNSYLLFVGKGQEQANLAKLTAKLGLNKYVHFMGEVSPEDMGMMYRTANILLHPSVIDSFSMVCLEAMSYGLAVVCTDAIGLVEYIDHQHEAIVVPAEDEAAFAQAVSNLATSPELRQQIGRAAQARARQLSWTNTANQLGQLYQSLLSHE